MTWGDITASQWTDRESRIRQADFRALVAGPMEPLRTFRFDTGQLPGGFDFIRPSSATVVNASGFYEWLSPGLPRFDHDPVTGRPLGLLTEGQRTNLIPRSRLLIGVGANGVSVTGPYSGTPFTTRWTRAPAGESGGIFLTPADSIEFVAGTVYTFSVLVRPVSGHTLVQLNGTSKAFGSGDRFVNFNLSGEGSVGRTMNGTGRIERTVQGFYRISATFTADQTGTGPALVLTMIPSIDSSWRPSFTSSEIVMDADCAQVEAAPFASSFIQTTNAVATRSGEVCYLQGRNWMNEAYMIVFEGTAARTIGSGGQSVFMEMHHGTAWTRTTPSAIRLVQLANGRVEVARIDNTGAGNYPSTWSTYGPGEPIVASAHWRTHRVRIASKNRTGGPVTTSLLDGNSSWLFLNNLHVGCGFVGQNPTFGHTRRLTFYSLRTSSPEIMQTLLD